jgi:dihydroflavonol-4-reductase
MAKIMILGGTGFLGYYTALEALKKGYEVGSISLNDVNLEGWYPKEIKVQYADLFTIDEDKLSEMMKGYDYMIYSVGPDDRLTPPAPSYQFFHERLVDHCAKCFRAAEKAGIKKAVVYNSYFNYFNTLYPEAHLAEYHPYIRCRVEQDKLLNEQKKTMQVVVLMLPYIFGSMPERMPIWKDTFLTPFAYGKKTIYFPKGSTTMIAVEHIGEAGIGAIEYGEDGKSYPIGDENHSYNWMLDTMMVAATGTKRKIVNPAGWICALGAKSILKKDKKAGKEPGLNLPKVMTDIMSKDMVVPAKVMDEVNTQLHISRGGLVEAIRKTMDRCYPNKSFK